MRYDIFRKIDDGEKLLVASRSNLEAAQDLVRGLNEHWPAEYTILEHLASQKVTPERAPQAFAKVDRPTP